MILLEILQSQEALLDQFELNSAFLITEIWTHMNCIIYIYFTYIVIIIITIIIITIIYDYVLYDSIWTKHDQKHGALVKMEGGSSVTRPRFLAQRVCHGAGESCWEG